MIPVRGHPVFRLRAAEALALAALLLVALAGYASSQSAGDVTLAEYEAILIQTRGQIGEAQGQAVGPAVLRAASTLETVRRVVFPNGAHVEPAPLVREGDSQPEALARLDAVIGQLQAAQGEVAAQQLAALDRVMASDALNPGSGLLGWLRRLLAGSSSGQTAAAANAGFRLIDIVLTLAAGGVLVFVLARIVQAVLGGFLQEAAVPNDGGGDGQRSVAAARHRATEFARAGSYRDAVRQLYLATLLGLEDRGLLRIDRSLTNREVLASVARWQGVQSGLRPVVETFETVWYGEREPGREAFERYAGDVETAAALIAEALPVSVAGAAAPAAAEPTAAAPA